MAKPDSQARHGKHGGTADESARADGEDSRRDEDLNEAGDSSGDVGEADWGFAPKPGISKETKIGLALVVVLLCAFGFVLYQKVNKRQDLLANIEPAPSASQSGDTEGEGDESADDAGAGFASVAQPDSGEAPQQFEPGLDDEGETAETDDFAPAQQEPAVKAVSAEDFFADEGAAPKPPARHPLKPAGTVTMATPRGVAAPVVEEEFNPFAAEEAGKPADGANTAEEPEFAFSPPTGAKPAAPKPAAAKTAAAAPQPPVDDFANPFGSEPKPVSAPAKAAATAAASRTMTDPFGQPIATTPKPAAASPRAATPPQQFPTDDFFGAFEEVPTQSQSTTEVRRAATPAQPAARPAPVSELDVEPFPNDETAEFEPEPFDQNPAAFDNAGTRGTFAQQPPAATAAATPGTAAFHGSARPVGADPFSAHSPFPATNESVQAGVHVVQAGENYWTISRKHYGTGRYYMALAEHNRQRIPDPKRLQPKMNVLVPKAEILQSRYGNLIPAGADVAEAASDEDSGFFRDAAGRPAYRIGTRDTLTDIAQSHLGRAARWIQIYEMNRDQLKSPNDLQIGTVLRLPADASRVDVVQRPTSSR